ncbi:hypothetical protein Hanom_Chr17g01559171 [Helianthus anomalus]
MMFDSVLDFNFDYCLITLFELYTKFSSPATVEFSLPAAQPLLTTRTGSPVTRVPSTRLSNSGSPFAFRSFLLFLSSSLSFLSHCSTVLCKYKEAVLTGPLTLTFLVNILFLKLETNMGLSKTCTSMFNYNYIFLCFLMW